MLAESLPTYSGILYRYQREYLLDQSRFKAAAFCRQGGKTFTTTLECVLDCMEAEAQGRICKWTIFSVTRDRAKDAMEDGVKKHLRALGMAFEYLELPAIDAQETTYEVRFPGGSRIRCVAATENTCRGISENVMLDEFARIIKNRAIWAAIFPIVSRQDLKLRVISTFNGLGEKFYEIMFSPAMGKVFSRHIADIYRAVADGLQRDIEELKAGLNDPDAWAQEYECKPVDAATAWLTYELIDVCEDADAGLPELYMGGLCYEGVDFGRKRDLTTIYPGEEVGDVLWLRERIELERERWAIQKERISKTFADYRIVRAAMDETGLGSEPVEAMQEKHGKYRVEGVMFTESRKLDMATILKNRMEDRKLRIPRDQKLRDDLHSVRKVIGPTGHPRLVAPRENGSHADRFWALALLCAAAAGGGAPDLETIQIVGSAATATLYESETTSDGWGTTGRSDILWLPGMN